MQGEIRGVEQESEGGTCKDITSPPGRRGVALGVGWSVH